MKKPIVDVLLPYWGDYSLFKEAVESVRSQTNSNWRMVIADDHYPEQKAQEYIKSLNDNRITYIRHNDNIGITKNFNFLLDQATSPYFVMLGCDDRLLPRYIDHAIAVIGEADFYQPGVEVIDLQGKNHLPMADRIKRLLQPRKPGFYTGQKLAVSLCNGNWLYFPSVLWKTETVKKYRFNEDYSIAEDLALEFDLIVDDAVMYFDNTVTFQYRRSDESLSSKEKSKGGVRFSEEDDAYQSASRAFLKRGWRLASIAAKLRLTSRLHRAFGS